MPAFAVRFNVSAIASALEGLLDRAQDLSPFIRKAARYAQRTTKLRFSQTKRDPQGRKWKELRDSTLALRRRRGNYNIDTMVDSGALHQSIKIYDLTKRGFSVGSDLEYAVYMQKGVYPTEGIIKGKRIPQRRFLGFSEQNKRRIREMLVEHLEGNR